MNCVADNSFDYEYQPRDNSFDNLGGDMSALLRAKGGVNGQNNGGSNNGIGNTGGGYNGNKNGVGNKAFDRNDPELERIMKAHPANPDNRGRQAANSPNPTQHHNNQPQHQVNKNGGGHSNGQNNIGGGINGQNNGGSFNGNNNINGLPPNLARPDANPIPRAVATAPPAPVIPFVLPSQERQARLQLARKLRTLNSKNR